MTFVSLLAPAFRSKREKVVIIDYTILFDSIAINL